MKVLHIISGGDTGGAKTHLIALTKELRKEVEMKILCFYSGAFYKEAKELGLPVELLNQKSRYDFSVTKQIINIIKDERYDIVHCHGSRANWYMFLAKPFIKVPLITTVHSDYRKDFEGSNKYRYFVFTTLNSIALRFFNYYIGVSAEVKNMLIKRKFNRNRIFSVYNGIDLNEKIEYIEKKEFAEKYNLEEHIDKKWVGIAARIEPVKGIDVFIKGANEVIKEDKNILFIISGAGSLIKDMEKLCESLNIKDNVKFLGHMKDINSFYNSIDINCLTSHSETFGYVLLEGARFRKPAISSKVGGVPEIIINGETGILFEDGDYKQFANAILKLSRDYEYASKLGENLYMHAKENFSVENMVKKHIAIYESVIKNKLSGISKDSKTSKADN